MAGFPFPGGAAEGREQKGGFLLPFLILCVSLFLTIGIVVYHARGGVESPSSFLQALVAGVYRFLGWSGSLIGLVLVLVWSLRACLGPGNVPKLRLRALGILGVVLGAAGVSGTAGYMEGVRAGGWIGSVMAPRMTALFGVFGSILVFSILLVASLLLATNWLFWDEFRRLAEKKASAGEGERRFTFPLSRTGGADSAALSWEPLGGGLPSGEVSAREVAELGGTSETGKKLLPEREGVAEVSGEETWEEEKEEEEEEEEVTFAPGAESEEWEEEEEEEEEGEEEEEPEEEALAEGEEEFEEEEEEEEEEEVGAAFASGAESEEWEEEEEEEEEEGEEEEEPGEEALAEGEEEFEEEEEEEEEAPPFQPGLFPEAELEEEEEEVEQEQGEEEEEEGAVLETREGQEEETMVEPEAKGAGGEMEKDERAPQAEIPRPGPEATEPSVVIPRPERGEPSPAGAGDRAPASDPELLDRAAALVMENGRASITMLQRKLQIRFAQASRLLDDLELLGVVGPYRGSLPREILMSPAEWEQVRETYRS